jgi:hypothetical protein
MIICLVKQLPFLNRFEEVREAKNEKVSIEIEGMI